MIADANTPTSKGNNVTISETPEPAPDPNELQEKLKSAKDALAAAKEKENSWANRALGATTTAATSLGAMQLAEGIAEKKGDEKAEKEHLFDSENSGITKSDILKLAIKYVEF